MNVAISGHGRDSWRSGSREEIGPLLHAIAEPPPRFSRTGKTFRALCGAQVATILDGTPFQGGHPRACPKCRRASR